MRGNDKQQEEMFSYVSMEKRVPREHPLRRVRAMTDRALQGMSPKFDALYACLGRPSIPPERLLRALPLQALYSVRSERQLMERLQDDLLFRWFVGLSMDEAVWDETVFTKNRDRLLDGKIADAFFQEVLGQAKERGLLSDEHFTVGGDKGYHEEDFIEGLRKLSVVPHITEYEKKRRSCLTASEREGVGFRISQSKRKLVEKIFGWMKVVAGLRKTKFRGRRRVDWMFSLGAAAFNLMRMVKLIPAV